jgi:hypothetical protein
MLIAALLRSLGYRVTFKTIANHADKQFSHVYTLVWDRYRQQWMALDTTVDRSYPGWEPEVITRQKRWRLGDNTDPGSTGQQVLQLLQPIAQGVGQRIAGPNYSIGLNSNAGSSGILMWAVLLVVAMEFMGGRRR